MGGRQTGALRGRKTEWEQLKKDYKAVAFSGPTIWGHLDARLVADWPPAWTHSCTLILGDGHIFRHCSVLLQQSVLWDFCWWKEQIWLFRSSLSASLCLSGLNIGQWIEFLAYGQFTPPPLFLLSTPFSLSVSLTFYIQLSPSPLCPTVPLRLSSYEIQDVTFFFFFPPAVHLNSDEYVGGNVTVRWRLGGVGQQKK